MSKTVLVTGPDFNSVSIISSALAENDWQIITRAGQNKAKHRLIFVQPFTDNNTPENDISLPDLPEKPSECILMILNMQNRDGENLPFQQSPLMSTIRLKTRKLAIHYAPEIRVNTIVNLTETEKIIDSVRYLLDANAVTGQVVCLINGES